MVVSVSVSASVGAGGSHLVCREVPLLDVVVSVIVSASVGAGGSHLVCREVPLFDVVVHLRDNHRSLGRSDRSDRRRRGSVIHRSSSTGRRWNHLCKMGNHCCGGCRTCLSAVGESEAWILLGHDTLDYLDC